MHAVSVSARRIAGVATAATLLAAGAGPAAVAQGGRQAAEAPRFRASIDLVNVTATVTDARGQFVPDLARDDFTLYEDGVAQPISYFMRDRVPISLGIVLDASSSMAGEKMRSAQGAINRFLSELLGPDDEIFLYRFSDQAELVQGWTRDRQRLAAQLGRIAPRGDTVLRDAVAEAVRLAQTGIHRKKAIVVISDGNDSGSRLSAPELRRVVRESEVLVYAVGIDGPEGPAFPSGRRIPGSGGRTPRQPLPPGAPGNIWSADSRVNDAALRAMTDDTGGRTEIIRSARDLSPATARIAAELSRQYFLAYASPAPKDGRWHDIRLEVMDKSWHVRARRGFVAS
jgi:Ca-activated chloride channel homolog